MVKTAVSPSRTHEPEIAGSLGKLISAV